MTRIKITAPYALVLTADSPNRLKFETGSVVDADDDDALRLVVLGAADELGSQAPVKRPGRKPSIQE